MLEALLCLVSFAGAFGLTVFLTRVWTEPTLRWLVAPLGAVGLAYLSLSVMVWLEAPAQTGTIHVDGLHEIPGEVGAAVFGGFFGVLRGTAAALLSMLAFAVGILAGNIYLQRSAKG